MLEINRALALQIPVLIFEQAGGDAAAYAATYLARIDGAYEDKAFGAEIKRANATLRDLKHDNLEGFFATKASSMIEASDCGLHREFDQASSAEGGSAMVDEALRRRSVERAGLDRDLALVEPATLHVKSKLIAGFNDGVIEDLAFIGNASAVYPWIASLMVDLDVFLFTGRLDPALGHWLIGVREELTTELAARGADFELRIVEGPYKPAIRQLARPGDRRPPRRVHRSDVSRRGSTETMGLAQVPDAEHETERLMRLAPRPARSQRDPQRRPRRASAAARTAQRPDRNARMAAARFLRNGALHRAGSSRTSSNAVLPMRLTARGIIAAPWTFARPTG